MLDLFNLPAIAQRDYVLTLSDEEHFSCKGWRRRSLADATLDARMIEIDLRQVDGTITATPPADEEMLDNALPVAPPSLAAAPTQQILPQHRSFPSPHPSVPDIVVSNAPIRPSPLHKIRRLESELGDDVDDPQDLRVPLHQEYIHTPDGVVEIPGFRFNDHFDENLFGNDEIAALETSLGRRNAALVTATKAPQGQRKLRYIRGVGMTYWTGDEPDKHGMDNESPITRDVMPGNRPRGRVMSADF